MRIELRDLNFAALVTLLGKGVITAKECRILLGLEPGLKGPPVTPKPLTREEAKAFQGLCDKHGFGKPILMR